MPSGTVGPWTITNGTVSWIGSGNLANITASDRSVIVWNSGAFNIAAGEIFSFQVSGGSVLNKVGYATTGALGSSDNAVINGTLSATGRVFVLANGNITVGGGASIQATNGVVFSTIQEPDTFTFTTSGNLAFTGNNAPGSSITLGTNATLASVIGNLTAYGATVSPNNITVNGDMIINTSIGTGGANLTGANGGTTATGNLTVVTNNSSITQNSTTSLFVGNIATLNVGNASVGNVTLTNAGNNFGTVLVTGNNVTLVDTGGGITLGTSTIGSNLTVNATGNILTSGPVTLLNPTGTSAVSLTTVPSTGNIVFANGSNLNNGTISASAFGNNVTIDVVGNATIGNVATGGQVGTVNVTTAGAGYVVAPNVTITGGGVTGATATATVNTTAGTVTGVSISLPAGQFLTSTPGIVFSGGGNIVATANSAVASGSISTLGIVNGGKGYTANPTVSITGGGGTGAQADAVVSSGSVTSFILNNAGTGYTSAPTITLVGGTTNVATAAVASQGVVSSFGNVTLNATGILSINGNVIVGPNAGGGTISATAPSVIQGSSNYLGAGGNAINVSATAGNAVIGNSNSTTISVTAAGGNITQPGSGVINTAAGSTSTFNAGTGNIVLTNPNAFGSVASGATLILNGNQVSVTTTRNLTLQDSTSAGNMTINTAASSFANGTVTLGAGLGTSARGVTVGGGLNISTNGSNVSDDLTATQTVFGAVSINTTAAGYGVLASLNVTGGGAGYVNAPTVTVLGTSGATATATVSGGVVTGFTVTGAGSGGFNAPPTLSLLGGGAPTTAASSITPVVTNPGPTGIVTSIPAPGVAGAGYVVAPQVTLSGGGGSGATATATINSLTGVVTGFTITSGGIGYTSAPSVTLLGGGAPTTVATNSGTIATGGTVNLSSGTGSGPFSARASYGQFNVTTNSIIIAENQSVNVGNISANSVNIRSVSGNILFTGNTSAVTLTSNANTGSTTQVGALNVTSTASFNASNTSGFGVTLDNASNLFGGSVTVANGFTNIIVSGGNLTYNAGSRQDAAGTTTIRTVDTVNNLITLSGNQNANSTWTVESAGSVVIAGGTFRNLTVSANNSITQSGLFHQTTFGALTLKSGGNVTLNNSSNNLTTVVLNGTVGDTAVSSNRSLTISGNSTGNVSVEAGTGALTSFSNPWNLTLGNMNVLSLDARVRNGAGSFSILNGNSGTITQAAGTSIHSEAASMFSSWNGDIIVANPGNSFGAVTANTLSSNSTANITFSEDGTLRLSRVDSGGNVSLTSRFGSVIEDTLASVFINVNNTASTLTVAAPGGSISLGGLTNSNNTTGNVVKTSVSALGSAAVRSDGNLILGPTVANSFAAVSGNSISQSDALKVFALASFNATNNITLTNPDNNFGPLSLTTTTANRSITVTEAGTLNLRTVAFPGSGGANGTFTATSVSGDIIDTGLGGVKPAGLVGAPGSGIITLAAVNGNIILDDPTTDLLTTSGVVFNAQNVTLSVLGSVGSNLVLGANNVTSTATGNLLASSALGNIGNAGPLSVGGNAFFQTGNGNITIANANVGFGSVRFIGNQVNISETGNMDILTGSTAYGPAQFVSGGSISVVDSGGGVVSFGNTVSLAATGNITLQKLQAVGTLAVTATGTKNLSALSLSADLNNKTPVDSGTGPGPSTDPTLAPKP